MKKVYVVSWSYIVPPESIEYTRCNVVEFNRIDTAIDYLCKNIIDHKDKEIVAFEEDEREYFGSNIDTILKTTPIDLSVCDKRLEELRSFVGKGQKKKSKRRF